MILYMQKPYSFYDIVHKKLGRKYLYLFTIKYTGPIASILVNKYGCRLVTMVGAVITSTGFILSIFSPNVEIMIVTYGLMGGNHSKLAFPYAVLF